MLSDHTWPWKPLQWWWPNITCPPHIWEFSGSKPSTKIHFSVRKAFAQNPKFTGKNSKQKKLEESSWWTCLPNKYIQTSHKVLTVVLHDGKRSKKKHHYLSCCFRTFPKCSLATTVPFNKPDMRSFPQILPYLQGKIKSNLLFPLPILGGSVSVFRWKMSDHFGWLSFVSWVRWSFLLLKRSRNPWLLPPKRGKIGGDFWS